MSREKRSEKRDIQALLEQEFPVERHLLYLNHAAVAPWPQRTADAVVEFVRENVFYGAKNYLKWVGTEATLREQVARLINAPSPDDVALLKNTSEALSVVAHGFPWHSGDNVVISDEEFPSNRIVWESLDEFGVQVREVSLRDHGEPEEKLIEAADSRTRLLSISSVQYASGLRMDLNRLGRLCKDHGIALCVDAIQGLGAIPHDVNSMQIDFLMADGHKWMLGPEGLAVFYCRDDWRERLRLRQFGWHMVEKQNDFDQRDWTPADSARRFECGSPNMLGIFGLSASLSLLQEIGIDAIEQRILERVEYLFQLIKAQPQLELISDSNPGRYAGIVTFRHRQQPADILFQQLRAHNVICAPRGGGIRFSPHCYTRNETLEAAVHMTKI